MASPNDTDDPVDNDEHKAWNVVAGVMFTIALALVLPGACDLRAQGRTERAGVAPTCAVTADASALYSGETPGR